MFTHLGCWLQPLIQNQVVLNPEPCRHYTHTHTRAMSSGTFTSGFVTTLLHTYIHANPAQGLIYLHSD